MGLRDRLRGMLGRERADARTPEPLRGPLPRLTLVRSAARVPNPVDRVAEGARLVALTPAPGATVVGDVREFARDLSAGSRVVVTDADPERAAGLAERLCALGVDADWLRSAS